LAPDELRRRQLAALTASVLASARVQPVVLAVEGLHWGDPTTLDGCAALPGQARWRCCSSWR
jgi:predicted ATPase